MYDGWEDGDGREPWAGKEMGLEAEAVTPKENKQSLIKAD